MNKVIISNIVLWNNGLYLYSSHISRWLINTVCSWYARSGYCREMKSINIPPVFKIRSWDYHTSSMCFIGVWYMSWWRQQMEKFLRYWHFVRGIHRSSVNSPHKDQWRGALMFSLIYAWTNSRANNGDTCDLRRHRTHYDVIVMVSAFGLVCIFFSWETRAYISSAVSVATEEVMTTGTTDSAPLLFIIPARWYLEYDVIIIILGFVIVVLGAFNWLILLSIITSKKLRQPFNILVAALAFVDGVIASVVAPMELRDMWRHLSGLPFVWCKVKIIIRGFSYYMGMFLVLVTGLVRLMHGVRTTAFQLRTVTYILLCGACVIATSPVIYFSTSDQGVIMLQCLADLHGLSAVRDDINQWAPYMAINTAVVVCTVSAYVTLICVLRHRERKSVVKNTSCTTVHLITSNVAAGVLVGFLLSYVMPFVGVILAFAKVGPPGEMLLHDHQLYTMFTFAQAAVHPLVYLIQKPVVRQAVRRLICLRPCHPPRVEDSSVAENTMTDQPSISHRETQMSEWHWAETNGRHFADSIFKLLSSMNIVVFWCKLHWVL